MVKMVVSSVNVEHAFINLSDGVELKKKVLWLYSEERRDDNITQHLFEKYEENLVLQVDEN
jgi:hypothetical protein